MITDLRDVGLAMEVSGGYWIADNRLYHKDPFKVVYKPILENYTQDKIIPHGAILHSNASPAYVPWYSLWKYWQRADITGEAHFQSELDGTLIQSIDYNVVAHCNYKANRWTYEGKAYGFISFETADYGAASLDKTPWNQDQLEALIGALTVQCLWFGNDCTTPVGPFDSGIGYHSQYPEWSPWVKTCPGAQRIKQMDYIRLRVAGNILKFHELRAA